MGNSISSSSSKASLLNASETNILKLNLGCKGNSQLPNIIFILDGSGSMGSNYKIIKNEAIPKIMKNIGYSEEKKIVE